MDVRYLSQGIAFVWDQDKAHRNPHKHGVTFEQATEVFFDPFLRVVDASRNQEARDAVIGMDRRWHLLFVVHIDPGEDEICIISAREATRKERLYYENG